MGFRRWTGKMKKAGGLLCLALCLCCGVSAVRGLAAEPPAETEAPLFVPRGPDEPVSAQDLLFLQDGVVPVHEGRLPETSATPEPGRATGPVEETVLGGGQQVDNFFVRDSTDSGTDLWEELTQLPDARLKGDGSVEILIYHTHTSEAYADFDGDFYYLDGETRSTDPDRGVVAAGKALKEALEAEGYGVVHDTTVNDGLYNGSYARSWEVIQRNLQEYPGIRVTIDVHRDAMTAEDGLKYKPTVTIGGRKAAQFMLLAGCDADGGWGDFPNWRENLRLMLRIQQKAEALYPGLARPLNFSNSKYNMNATTGSILVEIGTDVNTVSEARCTGKLLGQILAETFDSLR